MTPAWIHSRTRRIPSIEWPWIPIWVTTPVSLAASANLRASQTWWVRGFWQ